MVLAPTWISGLFIMNIVVEKQPKCVATLRVEIPAEKVNGERNQIITGYANKARVPGYRPGKAPRTVVEKRFQKEIAQELNGNLINEAYDEALKQESLHVLDFGVPENVTTHPNGTVTFVSKLTLAPEVALPDYKGVNVTVPLGTVPEEDIDAQLTALQERFAEFNDITDRPAAMADFTVVDYTSSVDGKPTEEFLGEPAGHLSGREGFWIRLDEEAFLPGFAVQMTGMNIGDSREITVTLPEDFQIPKLANKEMVFQVTIKELKQAILPALDDAMAERLAPGKTMADIKEIIRTNMSDERNRKISDMKVNQIVAHFNSLVSNLRTNFILQEIARIEKIHVTDNELINHLAQIANSRKIAPKKFIKDMQRAGRLQNIRSSMAIGKTIDFLVEHANVVESNETTLDA